MKVHRSNRLESLLAVLVRLLQDPSTGPLCPEPIVVGSRAMAVWLKQRLAEHFGAWAHPHFPFPRRFIEDAMAAVLGPEPAEQAQTWSRARLGWAIQAELPGKMTDPRYEPLARYLADDPRAHASYGLAEQIADVFDQYLVFRPDMVLGWQRGRDDDDWQADLWRTLTQRLGPTHLASLSVELEQALRSPSSAEHLHEAFGGRVCAFGVSTLPPLMLQLLDRLSAHLDVHLLVVSPSREYWAEIRSQRESLRAARQHESVALPEAPEGNPLLASFGTVGRDFQRVLEGQIDYDESADNLYLEPPGSHALSQLQGDVLHLQRRGTPELPALPLFPQDASLAVHACHSPMREVEVLHDQLLALLSGPDAPPPHEVVVLMTDVETYAPLVEAVFERDRSDPGFIPYCIADRSARSESPVVEAFYRLLEMVGGRLTASEILDLLALSAVQRRFELSADDVDRIAQWITESGVRWGIDGRHRSDHGQPRYEENTWRFGLRRLLLGYAMRGHGRETYAGVLPYDEVEGGEAVVLGKLAQLCDELFTRLTRLEQPRPPEQWRAELSGLLDALLDASGDAAYDHQRLRTAIDAALADAEAVGFTAAVDGQTVRRHIEAHLSDDHQARGFLSGGVTFCAMLPLRSLPFSTVCLLGMSDGSFPRPTRRVSFDRIAIRPRPGDRSRRAEDRYLFLEAVLMARDRLWVTYVGQSIVDNASRPPSVALAELLDVIGESFVVPGTEDGTATERAEAVRDRLVVRHPMQPFSPRYFGADEDPRLFSYAQAYLQGARAVAAGQRGHARVPLITRPLPVPSGPREVGLPQLVRFFQKPPEELLKRRLGLFLRDEPRDYADREPIELDALESWRAGDAILEHRLEGVGAERSRELLRASGQLPLGTPGSVRWDELRAAADPIANIAATLRGGTALPPLPVDVTVDGTRIVGRLPRRWEAGMILHQYSRVWPKTRLGTWVQHLLLGIVGPTDGAHITALVGRNPYKDDALMCQFSPPTDPREALAALLRLYWIGQSEPLLLLPKSAWSYLDSLDKDGLPGEALAAARRTWSVGRFAERDDPYLQRLFGDTDPLAPGYSMFDRPMAGGGFTDVAHAVLDPLRAHMTDG